MVTINQNKCTFCGGCAAVCPAFAIIMHDLESRILSQTCTNCGQCAVFCPVSAISSSDDTFGENFDEV
jgi:L-aspartate semialdehyde sulfurtransferase ferredoxin